MGFYLVFLPLTVLFSVTTILTSLFDRKGDLTHLSARVWGRLVVLLSPMRLIVKGKMPPEGRNYVFLANHQSQLDIPLLVSVLWPFKVRFVAKESLFRIPLFGPAIRRMGCISIDRSNRRKAMRSIEEAVEQTALGRSILVFPEGTRRRKLADFKIGGIILALKTGKPIVPVVVDGTTDIVPRKGLLLHRAVVRVIILPPMETVGVFDMKDREQLKDELWRRINDAMNSE